MLKPRLSIVSLLISINTINSPLKKVSQLHTMANPQPKRCSFVFDFDGTITRKDTISTLFEVALSIQSSKGIDKSQALEEILSEYAADFESHVASYTPKKKERVTLQQEIEYQQSLKEVEMRSFTRVSKSGIFAGISPEEWRSQGHRAAREGPLERRNGFVPFLNSLWANEKWGIVSVNFSVNFVRGVMDVFVGRKMVNGIEIIANEPREEDGVLEGSVINGNKELIATSDGKLDAMKELLRRWEEKGEEVGQVYYFGDSGTDLECLKEAHVGFILSDNAYERGTLMETMRRIKMDVYHVEDFRERDGNTLYWAPEFIEIKRGIFK